MMTFKEHQTGNSNEIAESKEISESKYNRLNERELLVRLKRLNRKIAATNDIGQKLIHIGKQNEALGFLISEANKR